MQGPPFRSDVVNRVPNSRYHGTMRRSSCDWRRIASHDVEGLAERKNMGRKLSTHGAAMCERDHARSRKNDSCPCLAGIATPYRTARTTDSRQKLRARAKLAQDRCNVLNQVIDLSYCVAKYLCSKMKKRSVAKTSLDAEGLPLLMIRQARRDSWTLSSVTQA